MSSAGHLLRRVLAETAEVQRVARRAAFLASVKAAAWKGGATVDVQLHPSLVVGKDVTVTVDPGTRSVMRFGAGCLLGDRVLIALKGGQLLVGDEVDIRRDCVLSITGRLRIDGQSPISWGCVFHCSEDIHLETRVGLAEQVTVADSSHFFVDATSHFWHNVKKSPVRIGENTWLCPKATVTRGADIGTRCIVGSGSVVTGVVPDDHLATGVPAVVRPLPTPWTSET
jgi:acetyltransferase-like isoleucine patch superfamily enzyme